MTAFAYVAHVGDETPYPYRKDTGDEEFGFRIPADLIERLDAAEREHDAATEAVRRWIEEHEVPEVELFELEDQP